MLNEIKATVRKYWELSWPDLCNLKAWMKNSKTFNSFDVDTFTSPSLKVAVANADGKTVCMTPIETCYMVSAFCVNPSASPDDARRAGDALDAEIARQGQMNGVSKLLIVVPADHPSLQDSSVDWADFKEVRVFERKIPQTVGTGGVWLPQTQSPATYQN